MTPDEIMKEVLEHKLAIEKLQRKLDIYGKIPPVPEFKSMTDTVYFVSAKFDKILQVRHENATEIDFNMFHTMGYAKRAMFASKMIAMQLHCKWYIDRDFVPDWNNKTQPKYSVYFNHINKKFLVAQWESHERADVAFSTRQAAELCAEWLQENWKDYNYD